MPFQSLDELIEKAKSAVVKAFEGKDTTEREWLIADLDSYESVAYRIRIYVLEGSPAKGIILVNYGTRTVIAIDAWDSRLKTWKERHYF